MDTVDSYSEKIVDSADPSSVEDDCTCWRSRRSVGTTVDAAGDRRILLGRAIGDEGWTGPRAANSSSNLACEIPMLDREEEADPQAVSKSGTLPGLLERKLEAPMARRDR